MVMDSPSVLLVLLERGACVERTSLRAAAPVWLLAAGAAGGRHANQMLAVLLEWGLSPDFVWRPEAAFWDDTAHANGRSGGGASRQAQALSYHGTSLLAIAAARGNLEGIRLLIEAGGADIFASWALMVLTAASCWWPVRFGMEKALKCSAAQSLALS